MEGNFGKLLPETMNILFGPIVNLVTIAFLTISPTAPGQPTSHSLSLGRELQPLASYGEKPRQTPTVGPQEITAAQFVAPPVPKPAPKPAPVAVLASTKGNGSKNDWLAASGIASSDWGYVDYIVSREAGWNPNSTNPNSGAHGLPQALPYSKTGCGWVDAVCQLRWANGYATSRYGSWAGVYNYWLANHYW